MIASFPLLGALTASRTVIWRLTIGTLQGVDLIMRTLKIAGSWSNWCGVPIPWLCATSLAFLNHSATLVNGQPGERLLKKVQLVINHYITESAEDLCQIVRMGLKTGRGGEEWIVGSGE